MTVAFLSNLSTTVLDSLYGNAAALAAVPTITLANGTTAQIENLGVFLLQKTSILTPDNMTVIAALNGGNWISFYQQSLFMDAFNIIDPSQTQWSRSNASIASASTLALPDFANAYIVSGTTTINLISAANRQDGAVIILKFASNPTIAYNQTISGTNYPIILASHTNLTTLTTNSQLTLCLDVANTMWAEVARCIV